MGKKSKSKSWKSSNSTKVDVQAHRASTSKHDGNSKKNSQQSKSPNVTRKGPMDKYVNSTKSDLFDDGNVKHARNSDKQSGKGDQPEHKSAEVTVDNSEIPWDMQDSFCFTGNVKSDKRQYEQKHDHSESNRSQQRRCDTDDKEKDDYKVFHNLFTSKKLHYLKAIKEVSCDLFDCPDEYALAHCVAEDMHMNAGIAIRFRKEFKRVGELFDQNVKSGGCAFLNVHGRYIYYLVTKRSSSGKPTNESLFRSLCQLKHLLIEHNIKKLAMPTIGCGLDGLNWDFVKSMIAYNFFNTDVEIKICVFNPLESCTKQVKPCKKAEIVHSEETLLTIDKETIILYFGSEDGTPTYTIRELNKKFQVLKDYSGKHTIGDIIKTKDKWYDVYGCIVRKRHCDKFGFAHFESCLHKVFKDQSLHGYIAFERTNDEMFDDKLCTLIKFKFYDYYLYTCAPIECIGK